MTGPEHFRAGEEKLARSLMNASHTEYGREMAAVEAAQAQAHFVAAQASAWALLAASEAAVSVTGPAKVWAELFGIDTSVENTKTDEELPG
jgi:hypothetical protein